VSNKKLTNESLRKRLSIAENNYPTASKIIKETIEAELIKPFGEISKRYAKYVPYWA
jgi:predicted HTH transcriptional regulator